VRLWYDARDVAFLREDSKDAADIQGPRRPPSGTLVDAGYKPDAVIRAVTSEDMSLLGSTPGCTRCSYSQPARPARPGPPSPPFPHEQSGAVAMTTPLRTDAVRHDLVRSVPFAVRDAAGDVGEGDGLTLTGLAAVWDSPTEIDSWEGTFTEQIRKGAFRKTIREQTPVLQFDHGRHPLVGSIPIGRIDDIAETDEGLAVTARCPTTG
jgi:hypothetical protein